MDISHNIQYLHNLVQLFRVGMPVEISYEREGKVAKTQADIYTESDWYWPERGVSFTRRGIFKKACQRSLADAADHGGRARSAMPVSGRDYQ